MVWAASTVIALGAAGAAGAGAIASASASKSAANAQTNAANQANATQLQMYNQTREDQTPWRNTGSSALNQLAIGLGLGTGGGAAPTQGADYFDANAYLAANPDVADPSKWAGTAWDHYNQFGRNEGRAFTGNQQYGQEMANFQTNQGGNAPAGFGDLNRKFQASDFTADPGYEFRLAEGARGINNSAAARGGVLSGAALKAASKYNQNFASNEYSNVYNRYNTDQTNQFNRLASIAGVGQTANNAIASAGSNMANNVSQNQLSAGNARASGYVGSANALNSGIGSAYNMYQGNQLMNSLSGYGSTSGTGNYAEEMARLNSQT